MKYKYTLSPEFHRQLWLRFSPFRLLAAPLVVALGVIATRNLPKNVAGITQIDVTAMMYMALTIYYLTVIVWGTYEAATSMQEELRGNTWDFQRMSSITPGKLAFGKLFGATSFTWYFGLMALAVVGYSYTNHQEGEGLPAAADPLAASPFPDPGDDTLYILFCLAAAGIIAQTVAFLYSFADSMANSGRSGRAKPPRGIGAFVIGVIVGTQIFSHTMKFEALHLQPRAALLLHQFELTWYGHDIARENFMVFSLLFFIGWFLIGCYRTARTELMYRNLPYVWALFVASVVAWNCGFSLHQASDASADKNWFTFFLSAFTQMLFATYACMISEASDARRYARLAFYVRKREVRHVLENMPKWFSTVPLVLVLFAIVLMNATVDNPRFDAMHVTAFMLSFILFMIRDGCIIHAIHLGMKGRGASFAILFYYLVVYAMLPLVFFTSLSISMGDVFYGMQHFSVPENVSRVAGFFYPTSMMNPLMNILPVVLQAAAAALWLRTSIRKHYQPSVIANAKA